jgi:8-oxo-dGTP pyrophosphatase MutT (NUDIX family)
MHTIKFDEKIDNKKQAAFVIFYSVDGKPWENYPQDNSGRHDLVIPTCLVNNRADGSLGFIGGRVDGNETLEEASIREVEEEIGHHIDVPLEPIVAHDIGPITTHAFAVKMPYTQLRVLQDNVMHAPHFGSEVTGVFLPHLIDYEKVRGKDGGISNFLQNSMAPSVREELVHFLLKKQIFQKGELDEICKKAGFILDELLK